MNEQERQIERGMEAMGFVKCEEGTHANAVMVGKPPCDKPPVTGLDSNDPNELGDKIASLTLTEAMELSDYIGHYPPLPSAFDEVDGT